MIFYVHNDDNSVKKKVEKKSIPAISNTLCRLDTEYLILHLDLFGLNSILKHDIQKKWFSYLGGGSFIAQLVSQMIV